MTTDTAVAVKKYYPFHAEAEAEAVVVHCSDPRFQEAFQRFIREELGIAHPAPITIPGSVNSVGLEFAMPKHLKTLKDQVGFDLSKGGKSRLILVNHEDCKRYEELKTFLQKTLKLQQESDLIKAASLFKAMIPELQNVEVYMARLDHNQPSEEKIYFEKII